MYADYQINLKDNVIQEVSLTSYVLPPIILSAKQEDANRILVKFNYPVQFHVSNPQNYIYVKDQKGNRFNCSNCFAIDNQTYRFVFDNGLFKNSNQKLYICVNSCTSSEDIITSLDGTALKSNNVDENGYKVASIDIKEYSSFLKADIVDAYNRIVRLYFSQAVHINGNIYISNDPEKDIWEAKLDDSFTPIYENGIVIDGVKYSSSIIVQFSDLTTIADSKVSYNDNIVPKKGCITINNSEYSVVSASGNPILSNYHDKNNNSISYQTYTIDPYAQLLKVESISDNKARITFSEPVIFQTADPQNYIFVSDSVVSNKSDIKVRSVTPVDGTMKSGSVSYDITYETNVILPVLVKLVEDTSSLSNDGDIFAIGGLVKACSGKLVSSTYYENKQNISTAYFIASQSDAKTSSDSTNPDITPPTVEIPIPKVDVPSVNESVLTTKIYNSHIKTQYYYGSADAIVITAAEQSEWTNGNVTVNVSIEDSQGTIISQKWASGSQTVDYFVSNGTAFSGNSFTVSANGTYTVYAVDDAGNESVQTVVIDKQDITAPSINAYAPTTWGQTNTVTTTISDTQSGIVAQKWAIGSKDIDFFSSNGTTITGNSFTVSENGMYTLYAKDTVGNQIVQIVAVTYVDTTAPATPTNLKIQSRTDSSIAFSWDTVNDNSGIAKYIVYRNNVYIGFSTTDTFIDQGLSQSTIYTYKIIAYDLAGNISSASSGLIAVTKIVEFIDDFNSEKNSQWMDYGTTTTIINTQLSLPVSSGGKSVISTTFTNYDFECDITPLSNSGNCGVVFNARDFASGIDSLKGYYFGLNPGQGTVTLGLENNSYTLLNSVSYTTNSNTCYHIKISVRGYNIKIYINDISTAIIDIKNNIFSGGTVGLRVVNTSALFDNVTVNPVEYTSGANSSAYINDFSSGSKSDWTEYGISGSITGGGYSIPSSSGGKAVISNSYYTNFTYESDIKITQSGGNAGLIFRVISSSSGADSLSGYYVGLGTGNYVQLGKENYSWTELARVAHSININEVYHLKLIVDDSNIKIYVNDMDTPVINIMDSSFSMGSVGVRVFGVSALYDNISITPSTDAQSISESEYSNDFSSGSTNGLTSYGITGTITNGEYNIPSSSGGKSIVNSCIYSDFIYEADVRILTSSYNAGLIFRATNSSIGADNYTGYYIGLDPSNDSVILGKANNSWTQLSIASKTINLNETYHIKIVAIGSNIKVYVNDMDSPILNITDSSYITGFVGFRTFYSNAYYDNIQIINMQPSTVGAIDSVPFDANLSLESQTDTEIQFKWDSFSDMGAIGYNIYKNRILIGTTNSTSYTDTSIDSLYTYSYTVKAYDESGYLSKESNVLVISNDTTAPSVTQNITLSSKSDTSVTLSWDTSTDNIGVAGYCIYRNGTKIATTTSTYYTDTDLAQATIYNYTIKSYDLAGNFSSGNTLEVMTYYTLQTSLSYTSASSSLTFNWTRISDVTSYTIEVDGVLVEGLTENTYTINNLLPNTLHSFKLKAIYSDGESCWSTMLNVLTLLSTPEDVTVNTAFSTVTLTWSTVTDATYYEIYRNGTKIGTTTSHIYNQTGLTANTYYYIKACNTQNCSAQSNEVTAVVNVSTISTDTTLTQDVTYENLCFTGGTLNLNGYTLTVTGSLIQTGGIMFVNGGRLNIQGDYKILNITSANPLTYGDSNGTLKMVNESDHVLIYGDFIIESNVSSGSNMSAGTLEIKGNFTQLSGSNNNFAPTGTFMVVLSGSCAQTITFASSSSYFNILDASDSYGVSLQSYVAIGKLQGNKLILINNGHNISLTKTLESNFTISGSISIWGGTINLNGYNLTINGNLILNGGTIDVNGGIMAITGDLVQPGGTMNIDNGQVIIMGNYRIQAQTVTSTISDNVSSGILKMVNTSDYVLVYGNFITQSEIETGSNLSAGTLEIKGDFTELPYYDIFLEGQNLFYNFAPTGTFVVKLSGSNQQSIYFYSPNCSYFNILDVSEANSLKWNSRILIVKLVGNSINLDYDGQACTIVNPLTSDLTITGNIFLTNINLGGYKLTINGNMYR